ncbi:MAG: HipA domain-containing protein [Planctomycetaceae bacterium]|jgi:hypothetical protein|nr:HipA domain-containing protein [Planctomycetaceae bacterium]
MANFYDVSDWIEKKYVVARGSRNKAIVENPDDRSLYYFKTSLQRSNDAYRYEFWSEIIASAIGNELGFNTLHYDIAYNKDKIGCISKSMIDKTNNTFVEIIDYLRNYDNTYAPENKQSYTQYTFHFIESALKAHKLANQVNQIIKTIIFDSLIGNGDRHQENWGFIIEINNHKKQSNIRKLSNLLKSTSNNNTVVFSPIYDSGSCLGRELLDKDVEKFLLQTELLDRYINNDRCEIRWEDKKISHFELIRMFIGYTKYKDVVIQEIKRVISVFNKDRIRQIIYTIDENLPDNLNENKLPDNRKKLIVQLILLRFDKLKEVLL